MNVEHPHPEAQAGGVLGTFLKSPCHQTVELLGLAGLDFLIVDAEHAPFDRSDLDRILLAARSHSLACWVRVPSPHDRMASAALDMGAAGILFPRIRDANEARQAVALVRFRDGDRGLSPSPRAAEYGSRSAYDFATASDEIVRAWCQIETRGALASVDEIASLAGVDGLFIGRVDLAQALGADSVDAVSIREAVRTIADAGRRYRKAVGIHVTGLAEVASLRRLGITAFVCGSDQAWLMQHARSVVADFKDQQGVCSGVQ
jgi:2-keto-3-deoxy-L-rhamnonate aldolase RhmA